MTEEWEWRPTHNIVSPANINKIPGYDERAGEHLWMMITGFRVFPLNWEPGQPPTLDQENLIVVQGPACYYCEEGYSDRLARRRCKGKP